MDKIKAPFTSQQVEALNNYQKSFAVHPFTCCSPDDIPECTRAVREVDGKIIEPTSDGILLATENGWICPCRKYTQNWAHEFMTNDLSI